MVGDLEVSPLCPPSRTVCPASPSLPWVPWALVPHLPRYYAPLRLPALRLGSLRLRSLPNPLSASSLCVPCGSFLVGSSHQRQGSWSPGTPRLPVVLTRRELALPSSRVSPLTTCSALRRPRWYPAVSPYRQQGCCLPLAPECRRSPRLQRGLSSGPPLYSFRSSMTQPVVSLPPAPYSPLRRCTRVHY